MKKQTLKLEKLQVQSFVTKGVGDLNTVKGGTRGYLVSAPSNFCTTTTYTIMTRIFVISG